MQSRTNSRDVQEADVQAFPRSRPVQIGVFADLAQRAKGAANWDTYRDVVNLVARFLDDADPGGCSNAIHVSILEHLDFIGPRGTKAWRLMPPELQSAWRSIMEYNERLLGQPRPEGQVNPWEQPSNRLQPTAVHALRRERQFAAAAEPQPMS